VMYGSPLPLANAVPNRPFDRFIKNG